MTLYEIAQLIKEVPDFPKKGVIFKDITPILENGPAFYALAQNFAERIDPATTKLVAIESRGFLLGSAVAQHLKCGLVLVRKKGKLPRTRWSESYDLEYGTDMVEMHEDALQPNDRVTIIDDVLATGGTAAAVERLCQRSKAKILGSVFLMEIQFLKGREKLKFPATSLL